MVENPKIVENFFEFWENFYYLSLFSKFSEESLKQFNPFATI